MSFDVISINIGKPITFNVGNKPFVTSIFKTPIKAPVYLSQTNFEGDGQADVVNHGGVDKAVCLYPYEHYVYWGEVLNKQLDLGAFGENITVKGMIETDVHIGDVFQLDEAIVQITQPREPCYKIAKRYNLKQFPMLIQETGYSGYYLKVIEEGYVNEQSSMKLLEKHPSFVTVDSVNKVLYHDTENSSSIKKILSVDALASSLREKLTKRLQALTTF